MPIVAWAPTLYLKVIDPLLPVVPVPDAVPELGSVTVIAMAAPEIGVPVPLSAALTVM